MPELPPDNFPEPLPDLDALASDDEAPLSALLPLSEPSSVLLLLELPLPFPTAAPAAVLIGLRPPGDELLSPPESSSPVPLLVKDCLYASNSFSSSFSVLIPSALNAPVRAALPTFFSIEAIGPDFRTASPAE